MQKNVAFAIQKKFFRRQMRVFKTRVKKFQKRMKKREMQRIIHQSTNFIQIFLHDLLIQTTRFADYAARIINACFFHVKFMLTAR